MFFVFDLETITDTALVREVLDLPDVPEEELMVQAADELGRGGSTFLPPMFHRVVSWVGLWIEDLGKPVKEAGWSGTDEKEGLQGLFDELRTYKDFGLIHHNGRGFDLPVLTYRALRHQLQMPVRLSQYSIRYRYSRENIDLMDEFSNYGASSYPKLKFLGHLIDVPFKKTADGSDVMRMFHEGKLEQIKNYCHEDVLSTYLVWLSMKHTNSEISSDVYMNLKERARQKLDLIQQGGQPADSINPSNEIKKKI